MKDDGPGSGPHMVAACIERLSKSFGGERALASITLSIMHGRIHALLGQNGSGKSTMIKLLSGFHEPDPGGSVTIDGNALTFGSPTSSYRLGCRFVHQNLGLIPSLSVLDNLALGSGFPTTVGTIQTKAAMRMARETLEDVGLSLDPRQRLADLQPSQRTGVAVARALKRDDEYPAHLLVLDEPTATLPPSEVEPLLEILRTSASTGVAVLFVSHHLDEVFRVAQAVSVLRDGRLVLNADMTEVDRKRIVQCVVGGAVNDVPRKAVSTAAPLEPALEIVGLKSAEISNVSLTVGRGEIVGVAGLTGSGRETLLGTIFGRLSAERGRVAVAGAPVALGRPYSALKKGLAYLPPDRSIAGFSSLGARENLTLPNLRPFWSRLHLHRKQERVEVARWLKAMGARPLAVENRLELFSGGNQQKILFGKWLRTQPKVLLLDEPTQGVDVGAKAQLHRLILDEAARGMAVLLSSTDVDELALLADRVIVMQKGQIVGQLTGHGLSHAAIRRAFMGDVSQEDRSA